MSWWVLILPPDALKKGLWESSSSQRQDERWWYAATWNNQTNLLWDKIQAENREESIFSQSYQACERPRHRTVHKWPLLYDAERHSLSTAFLNNNDSAENGCFPSSIITLSTQNSRPPGSLVETGPCWRLEEEEKQEEQCGTPHATVSLALTHNCSDSQLFIEPAGTFNQGVFALLADVVKIAIVISSYDCVGYLSSHQESTVWSKKIKWVSVEIQLRGTLQMCHLLFRWNK